MEKIKAKQLSLLRKAIQDFDMIQEGDRVCVGVSGGKDSLTLLYLLASLRRFYPQHFELEAVTLTMGRNDPDYTSVIELCKELNVHHTLHETQIGQIVFDERKEKNPCALCANLRRGGVNSLAKELGCNKVALGHHMDDVLESYMMSTLYEGRIYTFSPVTYLDRTDLYVIRPMIYIEEKDITGFVNQFGLEPVPKTCEADGYTNRQYMKELLLQLQQKNRQVKSTLFGAIRRSNIPGWNSPKF